MTFGWRGTVLLVAALSGCHSSTSAAPSKAKGDASKAATTSEVHPVPTPPAPAPPKRGPTVAPTPVPAPRALARRPKVALYERNPWLAVIGSDVPAVIVYADGSRVRARPPAAGAKEPTFLDGKIPADFVAEIERELSPLPESTSASHATDQPRTTILLETDRGWIRRSVYGMGPNCKVSGAVAGGGDPVPEGFIAACRALHDRAATDERAFAPPEIELMLWSFEHSREPPVAWPSDLPAPPKPAGDQVHYVAPGRYLANARALRASLGGRRAVLFDGRKWSFAARVVLPGDGYLAKVDAETRRAEVERLRAK